MVWDKGYSDRRYGTEAAIGQDMINETEPVVQNEKGQQKDVPQKTYPLC